MSKIGFLSTVLICLVWCARVRAQTQTTGTATGTQVTMVDADPQTPQEFFARARQLSDLEASGISFHLKATYVATGDAEFTGHGTYEEWWQSKDLWRKEATLGDYKYVEIKNGGAHTVYGSSDYVPWHLRQVLDAILIRIPTGIENAGTWEMRRKKINKAELIALSQEHPCAGTDLKPPDKKGQSAQKCLQLEDSPSQAYFTPEGVLRVQVRGTQTVVYDGMMPFQNLIISRNVVVSDGGNAKGFPISIELLELLNQCEKETSILAAAPVGMYQIVDDLKLTAGRIRDGVTPPTITHQASAVIPWSVRATHQSLEKSVLVEAVVDDVGNVVETRVIQSAGPDLDDAAMTAVTQYKFKPAKYKGHPVAVKINIVITFHISA